MKSRLVNGLGLISFTLSILTVTTYSHAFDVSGDAETYCKSRVETPEEYMICMNQYYGVSNQSAATATGQPAITSTQTPPAPEAENIKSECPNSFVEAQNACMEPLGGLASEEGLAAAGGTIQSLGMLAQLSGKSTQEYCSLLKSGGNALTGLNTGLGARCLQAAQSCVSTCAAAASGSKLDYSTYKAKCEALRVKSADYAKAALSSGFSAKMFAACEDAATSGGPKLNVNGNTSKPDCTNPANYQNPACAHYYQQSGSPGYAATKGSEFDTDSGGKGWDLDGDPQQDPNYGGGKFDKTAQGFQQQGGGGVGGGSGELPSGGNEGQGGYGSGPNTDVLGGERGGGGGGSVTRMGFESGGAGGMARKPNGSSFDLSKYLPQMKKDAKAMARAPAGLMRANTEIAPMTGNIFKNITDRMKALCHQKRLMECN